MQVIKDPADTIRISDPLIRRLVQERLHDLAKQQCDLAELGYFVIVEPGDSIAAIDAQLGFSVLANRFTGIRFDQPGFTPSFEFIEDGDCCFDMVVITCDDGSGIEIFIPKSDQAPVELIAMCQAYAIRA